MDEIETIQALRNWCEVASDNMIKSLKNALQRKNVTQYFEPEVSYKNSHKWKNLRRDIGYEWQNISAILERVHAQHFYDMLPAIEDANVEQLNPDRSFREYHSIPSATEFLFLVMAELENDLRQFPSSSTDDCPEDEWLDCCEELFRCLGDYDEKAISRTGIEAKQECIRTEKHFDIVLPSPPQIPTPHADKTQSPLDTAIKEENPKRKNKRGWWLPEAILLLRDNPGMTDNQIAIELGVSHTTLGRSNKWQDLRNRMEKALASDQDKIIRHDQGQIDVVFDDNTSRMFEDE
ncbi:hypothetical protein Pla110_29220 [Polystyrenella longa]|uniref:Uncharacterized protein n=1 Tax=Polystyrenella longa TaxID=2528007 RepID=A0A518CPQ7_9PLAN|nr:hypothetical protein [Polystyrenella longa]QDU81184.1 hypothetical protein Pla110_29220 [Polystyrenella longa]